MKSITQKLAKSFNLNCSLERNPVWDSILQKLWRIHKSCIIISQPIAYKHSTEINRNISISAISCLFINWHYKYILVLNSSRGEWGSWMNGQNEKKNLKNKSTITEVNTHSIRCTIIKSRLQTSLVREDIANKYKSINILYGQNIVFSIVLGISNNLKSFLSLTTHFGCFLALIIISSIAHCSDYKCSKKKHGDAWQRRGFICSF